MDCSQIFLWWRLGCGSAARKRTLRGMAKTVGRVRRVAAAPKSPRERSASTRRNPSMHRRVRTRNYRNTRGDQYALLHRRAYLDTPVQARDKIGNGDIDKT